MYNNIMNYGSKNYNIYSCDIEPIAVRQVWQLHASKLLDTLFDFVHVLILLFKMLAAAPIWVLMAISPSSLVGGIAHAELR